MTTQSGEGGKQAASLKPGDFVKLKCDSDPEPSKFKVRQFAGERTSCRLIHRNGKNGGSYLFRNEDIEPYGVSL